LLDLRRQEMELLRRKYGPLACSESFDWIKLEQFNLPPGWNRSQTRILILVPVGYPVTPPDNFYVPVGLRTASETLPSNYTESQSLLGEQWGQFSFHLDGEWKPSADYLRGDNLLTFMLGVERRLKEAN
jgi:hypothetical protein